MGASSRAILVFDGKEFWNISGPVKEQSEDTGKGNNKAQVLKVHGLSVCTVPVDLL